MESISELERGVIFNVLFFLCSLWYGKTIRLPNLYVYKFRFLFMNLLFGWFGVFFNFPHLPLAKLETIAVAVNDNCPLAVRSIYVLCKGRCIHQQYIASIC